MTDLQAAPASVPLLDDEHLDQARERADELGLEEPLGPRRLFAHLTRADRMTTDWAAYQAMTTKKAPWPVLERSHLSSVALPPPASIDVPLSEVLERRRSKHHAAAEPMALETLSTVLHWSAGTREVIPAYNRKRFPARYAPSAGGLQPFDIYLVPNNVAGLDQGLYYYHPIDHALRLLDDGNMRRLVTRAATYAEWLGYASVVLAITGDFARVDWKYGERGYRFMHVDTGCLVENLYLTGTACGLHTCAVAAYYDDDVSELLGIDGDEQFPMVLFGLSVPPESTILTDEVRDA